MKRITLLLFVFSLIINVQAQQNAITDKGEEVILYVDGTWIYKNKEVLKETEIVTNDKKLEKDKKSSFLIKSNKINTGFWINPDKWSFYKAKNNLDAEYELDYKDGDVYAMIISEQVEIPILTLRKVAFEAAQSIAPDLEIVHEEYRTVNGQKVLLMQMDGTIQGIKFTYYGYYFSSPQGTTQFVTYTSQKLMQEYLNDCEKLLNGFVLIE